VITATGDGSNVTILNRQRQFSVDLRRLREWVERVLTMQRCADAEVGIVFVNDRRMREYNRNYRHQDKPTNVLAFALREGEEQRLGISGTMQSISSRDPLSPLGDVVISLATTAREAEEYRRPYEKHLLILLIHGLLHLMGYDHERSEPERLRMERRERVLLRAIWNGGD
jgi:rRNA maturation RNase YbeY